MNINRTLSIGCAAAALLVFQCITSSSSDDPQASQGGTGSEIVGVAEYPDSTGSGRQTKRLAVQDKSSAASVPAALAGVFMYLESFTPGADLLGGGVPRVYTGDDGSFRITDVPIAALVVEVNDGAGKALARRVTVAAESTTVDAGTFVLVRCGRIHVSADFDIPGTLEYYVGLKGTRIVAKGSDSALELTLDNVPTGMEYTLFIKVVKPFEKEVTVSVPEIKEDATTFLEKLTISQ
jgi:hypothetical protein